MNRFIAIASIFAATQTFAAEPAAAAKVDPKAAFERMKTLAGEWQGQAGYGVQRFPATVTYKLVSNGSVVMETLMPGTPQEMISMYHMADGELVMTHSCAYCAGASQPRMKLDTAASTKDELKFPFTGGMILAPANDGHVHYVALKFDGAALVSAWRFRSGGKEVGQNVFNLERVSATVAPAPVAAPAPAPAPAPAAKGKPAASGQHKH